jgi:hypothetical protein
VTRRRAWCRVGAAAQDRGQQRGTAGLGGQRRLAEGRRRGGEKKGREMREKKKITREKKIGKKERKK